MLTKSGVDGDWYLHIQASDRAGNTVVIHSNRFQLDRNTVRIYNEYQCGFSKRKIFYTIQELKGG